MDDGLAALAGTLLTLFGVALLLWSSTRSRLRQSVPDGVHPVAALVLTAGCGLGSVTWGVWVLLCR